MSVLQIEKLRHRKVTTLSLYTVHVTYSQGWSPGRLALEPTHSACVTATTVTPRAVIMTKAHNFLPCMDTYEGQELPQVCVTATFRSTSHYPLSLREH